MLLDFLGLYPYYGHKFLTRLRVVCLQACSSLLEESEHRMQRITAAQWVSRQVKLLQVSYSLNSQYPP